MKAKIEARMKELGERNGVINSQIEELQKQGANINRQMSALRDENLTVVGAYNDLEKLLAEEVEKEADKVLSEPDKKDKKSN